MNLFVGFPIIRSGRRPIFSLYPLILLSFVLLVPFFYEASPMVKTVSAEPNGCWPIHSTSTNRTGPNVHAIQYLVRRQGYTISVDGVYGNETDDRIRLIQSANNLAVDGIVGPNTWQSGLIITLRSGDGGDGVRAVQHLLRYKFGYDIGAFGPNGDGVDGDFGQATVNAVQAFQQDKGIGVDGIVGPNTWAELVCLNEPAPATNTPRPTATNTPRPPTNTPTRTNTPRSPTNTPPPPTNTPRPATNTPLPPANTATPMATNTNVPPSTDQVQYPSGALFDIVALNQTQDGIDYSDPVINGRIPLIDLNGRTQEKLHTNFTAGEFQTNDGARYARIASELVTGLQKIRDAVGGPVSVNSGYRHPAYNASIDGATSSRHMTGEAADISASGLTTTELAEIALQEMGCNIGIGLYSGHIHVDVRGFRASWVGGSNPPMSEFAFDLWVAERCESTSPPTATPTQRPTSTSTNTPVPPPSGLCWNEHSRAENSVGNHVYAIQYLARSKGENIAADGMFGPNTEAAIKRLQGAAGLTQSGIVDGQTWENALIQTVASGDNGDAVRAVQYLLAHKFGYDLGAFGPDGDGVDGDFGQKTIDAVTAFQQSSGLTANGSVNPATWSAFICNSPQVIVPPTPVPSTPVPVTPGPTRVPGEDLVIHSQSQGFDTCTLPNISQMQTWSESSPYEYVGIYIGGENRGCNSHNAANLTENWVSQASGQGWDFIPIWVGPQAPGNSVCNCSEFSCNVDSARSSGVAEARKAADAANVLGLTDASGQGTIIYYDLEGHGGACRDAAKAFMDGWVTELHSLGNLAGIYGSSRGSYMADFADIDNVPDAVWPANWLSPSRYRDDASPYSINGVADNLWAGQRIRQYAGDHNERYSGVSLNIDSNVADGPIATSGFGQFAANQVQGASVLPNAPQTQLEIRVNQPLVDELTLLSIDEGWALTENGLAWTLDGGQTWLDITPPLEDGARLDDVFFLDTQTGWMVTNDAQTVTVYRTANRGQKWDRLTIDDLAAGASAQLFADAHLHFNDVNLGWMTLKFATSQTFKTGQLYKTTNGGATWSALSLPIGDPVTFVNETVGWVAGGPGGDELYRTVDGGLSWEPQSVVAEGDIDGRFLVGIPVFSSEQAGLLPVTVIEKGGRGDVTTVVLYETGDGGNTWTLSDYQPTEQGQLVTNGLSSHALDWLQSAGAAGELENVVDLNFATANLGWAQTSNASCDGQRCEVENRTLKTTDGGQTWVDVTVAGEDENPDENGAAFELYLPLKQ